MIPAVRCCSQGDYCTRRGRGGRSGSCAAGPGLNGYTVLDRRRRCTFPLKYRFDGYICGGHGKAVAADGHAAGNDLPFLELIAAVRCCNQGNFCTRRGRGWRSGSCAACSGLNGYTILGRWRSFLFNGNDTVGGLAPVRCGDGDGGVARTDGGNSSVAVNLGNSSVAGCPGNSLIGGVARGNGGSQLFRSAYNQGHAGLVQRDAGDGDGWIDDAQCPRNIGDGLVIVAAAWDSRAAGGDGVLAYGVHIRAAGQGGFGGQRVPAHKPGHGIGQLRLGGAYAGLLIVRRDGDGGLAEGHLCGFLCAVQAPAAAVNGCNGMGA